MRGQLEVLRSACREVQGSQDFTTLLQAVLALGNHLNEGTHKGNASGTLFHNQLLPCLKLPYPDVNMLCSDYGVTTPGTQVLRL